MAPRPVFVLEQPHYHRLRRGEPHRFRGVALALAGPPLRTLRVCASGNVIAEAAIDRPSPELAGIPVPNSPTCRFELDLAVGARDELTLAAGDEVLFNFDAALRSSELAAYVDALPLPPPELVARTQGGTDVQSYRDSMVASFLALRHHLGTFRPDTVLDIGCGTGRLLAGWRWAGLAAGRLIGVDVDEELIAWNRRNLMGLAVWRTGDVHPPVDVPDASVDLLLLASVFTHLPWPCQQAWVREVGRLLRPGGTAVISLHGEAYSYIYLDPAGRRRFHRLGYAEVAAGPPGSAAFLALHSRAAAQKLFRSLVTVEVLPQGRPAHRPPSHHPIAALQDVYILRKEAQSP